MVDMSSSMASHLLFFCTLVVLIDSKALLKGQSGNFQLDDAIFLIVILSKIKAISCHWKACLTAVYSKVTAMF